MLGTLILALFAIFIFGLLGYVHYYQWRLNALTQNWPQPPSWPIIGHLIMIWRMYRDPIKYSYHILRSMREHRVKVWLGTRLYLFNSNPEDIAALCSAQELKNKSEEYIGFKNWLCEGLFTSNGEKWTLRRKLIMPAFNYNMMLSSLDVFQRQSQVLLKRLADIASKDEPIEFLNVISSYTLNTICESAMGVSATEQSDRCSEYVEAVHKILHILLKRSKNLLYRYDFIYKRSALAAQERSVLYTLHEFSDNIIRQRRQERSFRLHYLEADDEDIGKRHNLSFLDTLLEAKYCNGERLFNADIREEVNTMIFAGFETTATAFYFLVHNLTKYPKCQQLCRDEIWQVCGKDPKQAITLQLLNKLVYLDMCVKETLRLYPTVPFVMRKASTNCQINDYFIPAGSTVIISPMYMGQSKAFFPQPKLFKPERWARDAEPKIDPNTWLPFMKGLRSCVGQRYAMINLKFVMAQCLRCFEFEAPSNQKLPELVFTMTLRTRKPIYCKVKSIM